MHWLIYEPAYKERWTSDQANKTSAPDQYRQASDVIKKGRLNYLDLIKYRAKQRGWKYEGISTAQGFWDYINKLKSTKVSRVWFYGHAKDDLWLSLKHDTSDHEAVSPNSDAILTFDDIKKIAAFSFVPQKKADYPHKFFGCNTKAFAEKWANALSVFAEGSLHKVDFQEIHDNGGMVILSEEPPEAQWYQCAKASAPKKIPIKPGGVVP
ncbi:hypothetical protein D7Y21_33240 [Corallococcus sp. AB045]|nr:hypothetical protein D7Y21_33240 [Corallococcus sp. AB045]